VQAIQAHGRQAECAIGKRLSGRPSSATQRDRHIAAIEELGRIGWQHRSGCNRRSLVETAVYRYTTVVGRRLHARTPPNQRTEAKNGCSVLNRMTTLGMPATVRIR
jgi:hypothetical protein